jgi:hypothetical protein
MILDSNGFIARRIEIRDIQTMRPTSVIVIVDFSFDEASVKVSITSEDLDPCV